MIFHNYVELLTKIATKINKNSMNIQSTNFDLKKYQKKGFKIGFGRILGTTWEGFEKVWAVFLNVFCSFFGILNRSFFKHGPKAGSKKPFGSILGGFGRV